MHTLFPLALIHLLMLMTPGPDILLVGRTAAAQTRVGALWAAAGIALGVAVWAGAALLGLDWLFRRFPEALAAVRTAGGLYLIWMGLSMWRASLRLPSSAGGPGAAAPPLSRLAALRRGALTNLSNPKAAVYFGSMFSGLLGAGATGTLRGLAFVTVVVLTWAYFSLMAYVLSGRRAQAAYQGAGTALDRVSGSVMLLFGAALLIGRH